MSGTRAVGQPGPDARSERRYSFGATRVGPLLARLRLHLATDRFLAEVRRDTVWTRGCNDAGLALERLEAGLGASGRKAPLRALSGETRDPSRVAGAARRPHRTGNRIRRLAQGFAGARGRRR